ncbi:heavy metal translocating P-type ATPase [Rhodovulum strictum]|uniref:P-type Zn(2+) transporter n=1 Tax=Rhodovulum strictum TaxID=58314 RepID=A0A844BIJ6_9RHOB|nr:heavy metal translocating P-type ATPase [Rhodovulum strictum]MRH22288.1 cadmium-translocating P-type ATPase [Rhodovulum strictum]
MKEFSRSETMEWHVTGLDCASCAARIRTALERLPGTGGIEIALMDERLRLHLAPDLTPPARIEEAVRALGFGIARTGPAPQAAPRRALGPRGRLVLVSGAVLAAGWVFALAAPGPLVPWVFALACLIALLPVARRAVAALRAGLPFTIEMLMTLAATGALVIGETAEAAVVVFLFAVGELLEGIAANRARDGIRALARLTPATALLEHGDHVHEVGADSLRPGQILRLRPGDRLAVDGEIVEGVSGLDESAVTGESLPVTRGPGAVVIAGSINTEALLRIRVTRAAADSTLARIARMIAEAEAARAPTERFIDRFARWYMPAIVAAAVLVAIVPPLAMGGVWGEWVYRALALLLIGCPCALVISVPAAIAAALSSGARRGLLLKGGAVVEALAGVTHVALDKTGTLTPGRAQITDLRPAPGVEADSLLALAAAAETGSSHPLARAIRAEASARGLALPAARDARVRPGAGVEARIGGALIRLGQPTHSAAAGTLEEEGKTVVELTRAGQSLGLIALRDEPRPEAAEALRQIAALGLRPVMLTGDNPRAAGAIAAGLGIAARAGLKPADKLAEIRALAGAGGVVMLGDGINDAPALKAASVGVAMGGGTDVALETADAAILRDRLTDLPAMIRLSRAAMRNIRQNVAIALGLKAVFLVTSVTGLTGLWMAVLADTGATVLVTANAMRLLAMDPRRKA